MSDRRALTLPARPVANSPEFGVSTALAWCTAGFEPEALRARSHWVTLCGSSCTWRSLCGNPASHSILNTILGTRRRKTKKPQATGGINVLVRKWSLRLHQQRYATRSVTSTNHRSTRPAHACLLLLRRISCIRRGRLRPTGTVPLKLRLKIARSSTPMPIANQRDILGIPNIDPILGLGELSQAYFGVAKTR